MAGVTIYSTPWCGPCRHLKDQLDRLDVTYDVVDIERDPAAAQLVERLNNGLQLVPTVVFPDGSVLANPSGAAVKARLCGLTSGPPNGQPNGLPRGLPDGVAG